MQDAMRSMSAKLMKLFKGNNVTQNRSPCSCSLSSHFGCSLFSIVLIQHLVKKLHVVAIAFKIPRYTVPLDKPWTYQVHAFNDYAVGARPYLSQIPNTYCRTSQQGVHRLLIPVALCCHFLELWFAAASSSTGSMRMRPSKHCLGMRPNKHSCTSSLHVLKFRSFLPYSYPCRVSWKKLWRGCLRW